ncbi:MAG: peptidoglycan DD-metalloendopeptidase family protein [Gammaproteobacteria bacterium]|nr:peptidoglycan DD-metalloendopeptidase family protein [Gammaproteobacteria bacterium]
MPDPRRALLTGILIVTSFLAGMADGVSGSSRNEAEIRARLESIQREISGLRTRVAQTEGRTGQLVTELAELETSIGTLSRKERSLDSQLNDLETRAEGLIARKQVLRKALAAQREAIGNLVRARYANGREAYLKLLLNLESPVHFSRYHIYYDYLNRARLARIDAVTRTLDDMSEVEVALKRNAERLSQSREDLKVERARLKAAQDGRMVTLKALQAEIGKGNRSIAALKAEHEGLKSLLNKLRMALDDIPVHPGGEQPFKRQKGKLPWPATGRIVRGGTGGASAQGVLIRAGEDEAVRAIERGRVAFADWIRGYGLLLIIDHGKGYMSLYGYNRSLYKSPGDWVEAGDLIARVGASAGRSTPGLYFGIRHNGKPLDPTSWCTKRVSLAD